MVSVIIKGIEGKDKKNFIIKKINAGVVLRDEGGIFLQLSSKQLSKALKDFFDNYGDD